MIVLCLALALQQPNDSITLSDALARADRARGTVATAAADIAGARGALRTAGAIPNPTVSYSHTESTPVNHFLVISRSTGSSAAAATAPPRAPASIEPSPTRRSP